MNTKSVIARSRMDGVEHRYTSVVCADNAGSVVCACIESCEGEREV